MKKIFILTAAALTVFAACSKEKDIVSEEKLPAGMVKASFYADIDQTKSTESGATFSWTENEQVAVVAADDNTKLTFTCDNVSEGHFTGTIGEGKSYGFAISPYNAAANMSENSGVVNYDINFASDYNDYVPGTTNAIMVGTPGASGKFMFRHAAAAFKFTVENVPVGTAVVSVATNANITGTVSKSVLSGSGLEISNSDSGLSGNEVDLYLKDAVTAPNQTLTFYVPVPTGNYTSLTVTFFDGNLAELESKVKNGLNINLSRGDVYYTPKMTLDAVTINKGAEWAYTFEQKVFSANGTQTLSGTTDQDWTLAGDGGYWSYDGTKGQQFGSGSAHYSSMTLTSNFGATYGISDVKINTSGASSIVATVSVSVGGVAFECEAAETVDLTTTATDYTFSSPDGNNYAGDVVISYEQTSSKAIYLKSITVNPDTRPDPELSFDPTSYNVLIGESFTAPTLSHASGFDGTVTYSIGTNDNPDVASVNENTGAVTIGNVAGTVTITASFAGDDNWKPASASYTIIVSDASTLTLTFPFDSPVSGWPSASGDSAAGSYTYNLSGTDYTFTHTKVGNGIYCSTSSYSSYLMIASGNYLGLPAISGYKLSSVSAQLNPGGQPSTAAKGTITSDTNGTVVTGGEEQTFDTKGGSKTFTLTGTAENTVYYLAISNKNFQCTELVLVYEAAAPSTPKVATPTISISGSDVSIACSTDGAAIYYTLDGSTPSTSSTAYLSSVSISGSQQKTIKAFATKASYDDSDVAEETYYAISVNATTNGTVTTIPYAAEGEEISLTVTPDSGYALDDLSVVDGSNNAVTVANNKFTMPASPVTVSATFALIPVTTIADVLAGGAGTYEVPDVLVYAVKGSALIIGDATGKMYAYKSNHGLSVGDVRTVSGTTKIYNEAYEFDGPTFSGSGTAAVNHGTAVEIDSQAATLQTAFANPHTAVYVHAIGTQSSRNITTTGGTALYLSAAESATDGKTVEIYGYVYAYSTSHSNFDVLVTSIEEYVDPNAKSITALKSSITGVSADGVTNASESGVYSLTNASDSDVTVTPDGTIVTSASVSAGTLTYSVAANTGSARSGSVTLAVSGGNSITISISQLAGSGGSNPEPVVLIIDGSQLTSTATTGTTTKTYDGVSVTFSDGAKSQSSSGDNKFTSSAILIGKSGKNIHATVPGNITKFEIYANKGASAKVSVGVNFSSSAISSYNANAANTYTATLSTVDHVYDCSSSLPSNANSFWYQVTNANNSQVEFRITYTPSN